MTFRQYLLKLHGRCNLSCTYCYVYEAADHSWRTKPRRMELATVRRVAERIAAYRRDESAPGAAAPIAVILHGGEPLLVGPRHLDETLTVLRDALDGTGDVAYAVQTNGVLLRDDLELLRVLRRHRVRIGVSVDGTAADHDRYRRFADGRGSHAAVAGALGILGTEEHRDLFGGVLCTVDPATDPVATYEALLAFAPPRMDLLLPHGTWGNPPPGLAGRQPPDRPPMPAPPVPQPPTSGSPVPRPPAPGPPPAPAPHAPAGAEEPTPYADWLCAVFDRWYGAPRRETGIRLFEELIVLLLGGRASSEMVGTGPADLVVVETDGSLELADSLKAAYDGAAYTGLSVFRDSFAEAARHPAFRTPRPAALCRACPLWAVCGGGLYAHRHHPGADEPFDRPTVYCHDMAVLIEHIRRRLEADVAAFNARRATHDQEVGAR
ncbi:radical SAM protein [Streptomyces sp. NBC_00259]|uniref:radical SAM protein n=1 Tax=Streptomyces sp. NBC_00259 TaxID=2903643 RepID=UPI002E2D1964|nr:radical SAM protein [Streptomyces sp. NBC_00259]